MSVRPLILIAALAAALPARAGTVDESALRYWAAKGETGRVAAEVRRLEALYPEWTAPADLSAPADDGEAPLWALYAKDDLDGLAAAVAELKAKDPSFAPSADLAAKIAWKTAHRDLVAASDRGDGAAVLALADAHPDLGGCADLDAAWRIAAARDAAGAEADYRRLLTTCEDAGGRRSTVEKALATLGPATARGLLALARSPGEFDALKPAIGRAAVAAALSDAAAPPPAPEDLADLAGAIARPDGTAGDAALLGWWFRKAADHARALDAFERAATLAGPAVDAKTIEGLVLSLDALGRSDEAYRLAADRRTLSPELADLQIAIGARRFAGDPRPNRTDDEVAAFGAAAEAARSAPAAEALGWWLHDGGRFTEARRWFEAALAFAPDEAAVRGAIYAALAAKDREGAAALLTQWRESFPALADVDLGKVGRPGTRAAPRDPILVAFERRDFARCLELSGRGRLKPDQNLWRGWCLMKSDRPVEAAAAFAAAEAGPAKVRADAVYGRSLALVAAGHVEDGAAVAAAGIRDPKRRDEIGVAVLADRAQARFAAKDYRGTLEALAQRAAFAPEPTDLALLRGWALWHLGRRAEARTLFEGLDRTYSTAETRRAVAAARNG